MKHELIHWLDKHPVGWFIALVLLFLLFRKAWKVFLNSGHETDGQGRPKDPNEIGPLAGCMLLIVCLGALAWLLNWHEPKASKAAAVPTPKITHTTIVQHITHVTQQVTQHGVNGWLIAFIAAVIVSAVVWLFRKLSGR